MMNSIRPRVAKCFARFELVIPMLNPRSFRGHEILKVNRLPSRPHTVRAAEIRNAATGGNSGAGEDQRLLRSSQVIGEGHGRIIETELLIVSDKVNRLSNAREHCN